MGELKCLLTEAPVLVSLDFSPDALSTSMLLRRSDGAQFYLKFSLTDDLGLRDMRVGSGAEWN